MKNENFNLIRAKQISDKLTDIERHPFKIQSAIEDIPGLPNEGPPLQEKTGPWLFYYSVWTFVENQQHSTLREDQSADKLKQFPDMEVTYCRMNGSPKKLPEILRGRKGVIYDTVTSQDELSDLIFLKTGVRVPETDLIIKQSDFEKLPLNKKVDFFMNKVNQDQQKTETRDRILQIADEKQKNECIKNCKK